MSTTETSAERIASEFSAGKWKVELEPEEVKNWHEISNRLSAKGLRHINMSGTTSAMIKPYAIDAAHRKNLMKLLIRVFKRLASRKASE